MWDLGIIVMPFYWVLELYDPAALAAIKDNFKEYTFEPFGPPEMKIMGKIKGRFDGTEANRIVREELSGS